MNEMKKSVRKKGAPRPDAPSLRGDYKLPAIPTAAATATTEATARTSFLGTRFIDRQSPATEIAAVERLDRLLSLV